MGTFKTSIIKGEIYVSGHCRDLMPLSERRAIRRYRDWQLRGKKKTGGWQLINYSATPSWIHEDGHVIIQIHHCKPSVAKTILSQQFLN